MTEVADGTALFFLPAFWADVEDHGACRAAGVGPPDFGTAQGNQHEEGEVAVSQLGVRGVTSEEAELKVLAVIW